jgi:hypothetical protein
MELWKLPLIIGGSAALVSRIMALWSGFPPPRHWRARSRASVWIAFAAATALISVIVYVLWELSEETVA